MYLCIYVFIHPSTSCSLYQHSSCMYLSIHLYMFFISISIYLSIYTCSISVCIYLPIYICPFHLCISFYLSVWSFYLCIYLSIHLSMPFLYLHLCPCCIKGIETKQLMSVILPKFSLLVISRSLLISFTKHSIPRHKIIYVLLISPL